MCQGYGTPWRVLGMGTVCSHELQEHSPFREGARLSLAQLQPHGSFTLAKSNLKVARGVRYFPTAPRPSSACSWDTVLVSPGLNDLR